MPQPTARDRGFYRKPAPSDWWHPIFHDRTPGVIWDQFTGANLYPAAQHVEPDHVANNRWTMGQSVEFFENDFAGRIAQKEMQTATSATNVVIEFVHTIVFSIASVLGAMVIVAGLDPLLSLFVLAWLVAYIYFIKTFMPKMRKRSAHMRTHARLLWGRSWMW